MKLGQGKESFDFEGVSRMSQSQHKANKSARRRKQWRSMRSAVYPGLACLALRHWNTWLALGPGQPQSAGLTGWELLFCQLLQSLTPGSRVPGKAGSQPRSAETGSPCSFQLQYIVTNPTHCVQMPLNAGPAAAKGRALSVTGNVSQLSNTED